ncbi:AAA family ATPase [Caldimonas tepidiphila]|uniref:AAA family ATPase n=1 Tax=Caldimonas tepidiphila TaxID=2315841 RepID=UPI000E5A32F3|nr:AAA family ATPase [Caldimonas tepidiphila]
MQLPHPDRLRAAVAALESGLLEREAAARLALLAALAGEHLLLIGPPGTAKSELARRLRHALDGARYFERLLTRFSVPEELFGPLSLAALEEDRYERLTEGYLPTAGIAFLDEVFKANSAILNALLTLLNEREFDNGRERVPTPLVCVVGATNEVPSDEALTAFYDRFLLRVPIAPVGEDSFAQLLQMRPPRMPALPEPIRPAEIAALREGRDAVRLPEPVVAQLRALRALAAERRIAVSDRRWRHTVGLLKTAALSEGRDAVDAWDLWLVPYCVASEPAQLPALQAWFVDGVAGAETTVEAPWLTRAVEAFEKQLELERSARQEGDQAAGKMALARSIAGSAETGITRIVAATLEERLRRRYSPVHVAARVAQVDEALVGAREFVAAQQARLDATRAALTGRVWLPPALARLVEDRLAAALATVQALAARLDAVRAGFAALPQDAALPAVAPQAVALARDAA